MSMLTDINRGVKDAFFLASDGLKELPVVVGSVRSESIVQICTFTMPTRHGNLIRDWDAFRRTLSDRAGRPASKCLYLVTKFLDATGSGGHDGR